VARVAARSSGQSSGDESNGRSQTGWDAYQAQERQLEDAELFGLEHQLSPDLQAELKRRHDMKLDYNDRMRRSRFLPEFLDACGGMEFNHVELYGMTGDVAALDRNLRLHGYGVNWDRNYYAGLSTKLLPPPAEHRFWLTEGELNDPTLRAQRLAELQPHMQFRRQGGSWIRARGRDVMVPQSCACQVCLCDADWQGQVESGEARKAWLEGLKRRRVTGAGTTTA
jgi:hypothetical protein